MIFNRDDTAQRATLALSGEIDLATAPALRAAAANLPLRDLERLTVDMVDVTFMDSTGVGFLVSLRKHMSPGSELVVANAAPTVRRVLEITGLGDLVEAPVPTVAAPAGLGIEEQSKEHSNEQGLDTAG